MNIIEKKDIDFDSLSKYECTVHTESNLFYDDNYMYKMFNEDASKSYLLRKKVKLEALSDGTPLDSAILPIDIIMDNKVLSGYTMNYIKNATPIFKFNSKNNSINDFFRLMYGVSLSLRNIHNDPRNIVVGDLSISNIIFDENMKHYFSDFDSVMIGKLHEDRVPLALDRYARRCGLNRYDINKSTDRLCLILATLFVVFNKSIEEVSMREYDKTAEKVETIKNMRQIVVELKKHNAPVSDFPYLDELISDSVSQTKKKIKTTTENIQNIR